MRKALLAAALAFGLFGTTSAQLVDSVMYDYGVLWNETMGFLRRDGGNTIKGTILMDMDQTYELGSDVAGFNSIYTQQLVGTTTSSQLILYNDATADTRQTFTTTGIRLQTSAAPNSWQATAFSDQLVAVEGITQLGELAANTGAANYAMGSTKLTGLAAGTASGDSLAHSLNPLNHLSTATAAYDMGGFGFSNWTGATSSNFAQIAVISNRTAAAGAGINLRWNAAAALAAGYYPLTVQYDDATGTRDVMKAGYFSTSAGALWLPNSVGGNGAGISEYHIVAGDSANLGGSAGTVGFRMLPTFNSGSLWLYLGGDIVLDMRKGSKSVSIGDGYGLANNVVFVFRAENSVTNLAPTGSYQFGYYGNLTPASGLQSAWLRGIAPGTQASTDFSNHIASLDYLGQFRSGQHGDAGTAPADGGFSAAGWHEASTATNQTGTDVYYRAGRGTGNSTTKGDIIFQTPDAGASGTTVQAITTKATIERDGDLALKAGTSTGTIAKAGGAITHSTTQVGNTALTETDLFSYSVPANTLETNGDSLDLFAGGTFTASASVDKRVRAYFGATTIFDTGALAITGATDWQLECGLIRSGAATQKSICTFSTSSATLSAYADYTAPGETLSGAVTLKVTGTGTLASDVVGELWKVLWSSAP